ncbi:hypothetical protein Aab01nite_53780 [Paractinoplanes abujensis]|nr:hypothetical protein Aab01nite_53780 [Actinoplanes abujensis]
MLTAVHRARPVSRPSRPGAHAAAERRDAETVSLIRRMRDPQCSHEQRRALRDEAVRINLDLAYHYARSYRDRGEALEDLLQVAALGLVKAVDGYNPARGIPFTGYATPTIFGELKRHFRDRVWSVHVPRTLKETSLEVTRTRADLTQRLQRAPSLADIAAVLDLTPDQVRAAEAGAAAYRADSLNRSCGPDGDTERHDIIGDMDTALEAVCDRMAVRAHITRLPPRTREVITRYFYAGRTQLQIAADLGISQMTVSRLLSAGLAALRTHMSHDHRPPAAEASSSTCRISEVAGRCVIVAPSAVPDDTSAATLRDTLVDLAFTRRPRTIVVDLRHLRQAPRALARTLLDAYRAAGHTGVRFVVVNLGPRVHQLLHRLAVTHIIPCHPRPETTAAPHARAAQPNADTPTGRTRHDPDQPVARRAAHRPACIATAGPHVRRRHAHDTAEPRPAAAADVQPSTHLNSRHGIGRSSPATPGQGFVARCPPSRPVLLRQRPPRSGRPHAMARIRTNLALGSLVLILPLAGCTDDNPAASPPSSSAAPPAVAAAGLPQIVAAVEPSVVTVLVGEGLGSGVVFRDGGLVLTNQHVVGDARTVTLALADGSRVDATVEGTDAVTDLAVLRAARTDLPPVPLRTELPLPGETVLAMGSPLGFRNSVTAGIVSGVGREIPGSASQGRPLVDLLQTDAAISPGNSGGALVDTSGRVVGINDAYLPPATGAVSIGFAIPAATALDVADDLLDDGKVTHPYLGVAVGRLTPQIAQALGTGTDRGVLVRDVVTGDPAAKAGLRAGDVITTFAGEQVTSVEAFLGALRGVEPGDTVDIGLLRGGKQQSVKVTVGAAER